MGLNATQYAEKHGIKNVRKIKTWYDAGYLGEATRDEKTGVYDIPEDTPLPHNANSNVSKLHTLWREILNAAMAQHSVFDAMYPKFQPGTVSKQIEKFSEDGLIAICKTASGAYYLEICQPGYVFLTELDKQQQQKTLEKVEKGLVAGASILQTLASVWPYIQQILITNAG